MWLTLITTLGKLLAQFLVAIPDDMKKELMRKLFKLILGRKSASEVANDVEKAVQPLKKRPEELKKDDLEEATERFSDLIRGK